LGFCKSAKDFQSHCIHALGAFWSRLQLAMSAQMPMWIFLLGFMVVVGCAVAQRCWLPQTDIDSPTKQMVHHSQLLVNRSNGGDNASIAMLQDKLTFKKMKIDLTTDVFTGTRDAAKARIKHSCDLPEKICGALVAGIDLRELKHHKKDSVPLDENEGSYGTVWMWLKQADRDDEVHIAFKGASMSYKLRDVVEYRDQVDEEPIIKCETTTSSGWFTTDNKKENCREVAKKKTVTPIPVFKTTIMSPQEMHLVDTMMETMLAKKVLEYTNSVALVAGGSSATD
jgi:hypothetical protein